ncbi:DUF3572 domain-containing protein [Sneathiella glossodoripedis]|uniref:DUF3572 domain-containing protein n=1 Tax=Sneathiella glossodoripedis TaxID=418853 RepID=UPI0004729DCB|nr:DUF3572 domain-containing protein [Sneathiella glossodoripedis]
MNQEQADIISLKAVTYLLSDEKRISWLLGETGLDVTSLRQSPDNPEILAGILDFLLSHENILVDFAQNCDVDPSIIYKIRPLYPGFVGEY